MSDRPSDATGEAADGTRAVTDAEWEVFQREAETSVRLSSPGGHVPKEPSARARMVTARLRALDAAAARGQGRRWGRGPKQPEPWQPEGWRTGPSRHGSRAGRLARWGRSWRVGTVCAVLCLLVCALWLADHRGHLGLGTAAPCPESVERPGIAQPGLFGGAGAARSNGADGTATAAPFRLRAAHRFPATPDRPPTTQGEAVRCPRIPR